MVEIRIATSKSVFVSSNINAVKFILVVVVVKAQSVKSSRLPILLFDSHTNRGHRPSDRSYNKKKQLTKRKKMKAVEWPQRTHRIRVERKLRALNLSRCLYAPISKWQSISNVRAE